MQVDEQKLQSVEDGLPVGSPRWLALRAATTFEPLALTAGAFVTAGLAVLLLIVGDAPVGGAVFVALSSALMLFGGVGAGVQNWARLRYRWTEEELLVRVYSSPGYYIVYSSGVVLVCGVVLAWWWVFPSGVPSFLLIAGLVVVLGLAGLMGWARWVALPRLRRDLGA